MQIARQIRLQPLGRGVLTVPQVGPASCPEQSNEPVPGGRDTHDGDGGDWMQKWPLASEYSHPSGQVPASNNTSRMASVGRVETDLGRPTGRVPASELSCVHRGGITGRFCHGSIACCLVAPGIRAAVLRSNRSSYPPSAAREHEPCDGKDERPIAHTKELPLGAACVKEASTS
jgi:hypothetical protein